MDYLKYALLGLVQGLTEFLPVSSSGHLAIAHRIVGIEAELGFDVAVHMGTALAVVIYYFRDILMYGMDALSPTARAKGRSKDWDSVGGGRLLMLLVITSIPAAAAGFLLQDKVEAAFTSAVAISAFLTVTGIILLTISGRRGGKIDGPMGMPLGTALLIGLAQALAIFPGISRSGMTIAAGIAFGLTAGWAVDYSMLASLPVILGAFLLQVMQGGIALGGAHGLYAGIGVATSLLTGLFAISALRRVARKRNFVLFAVWAFAMAGINLYLYLALGI